MIKPTFEEMQAELRQAFAAEDIWHVVNCRTQAEGLFTQACAQRLDKSLTLPFQEMIRRGERATAILVQKGQEQGTIRRARATKAKLPSPAKFLGAGKATVEFYDLAAASDEVFEAALLECREDQNMTRANVIRKIGPRNPGGNYHAVEREPDWTPVVSDRSADAVRRRRQIITEMAAANKTSRQMEERLGTQGTTIRRIARQYAIEIPADSIVWRQPHHDSNKIVTQLALQLEGLAMTAGLVKPDSLDKEQIPGWLASLAASQKAIGQLVKDMKEETA